MNYIDTCDCIVIRCMKLPVNSTNICRNTCQEVQHHDGCCDKCLKLLFQVNFYIEDLYRYVYIYIYVCVCVCVRVCSIRPYITLCHCTMDSVFDYEH